MAEIFRRFRRDFAVVPVADMADFAICQRGSCRFCRSCMMPVADMADFAIHNFSPFSPRLCERVDDGQWP